MILEATEAFQTYLQDNNDKVTGSGTYTVPIYKDDFPETGNAEGVCVLTELRESVREIYPTESVSMRIICRARQKSHAWQLAKNVNKMFDGNVHFDLDDNVHLMLCNRNAGPGHFPGESDKLNYYTTLYDAELREIDG